MIYPDVSSDEWSKRHKIEITNEPCANCGKLRKANIPMADKGGIRGFVSEDCECGQQSYMTFIVNDSEFNDLCLGLIETLNNMK